MSKAHESIMDIILYSDLYCTRFTLGLAEIIWAIALWWPGDTFTRPTYLAMQHTHITEDIWGCIWMFSGITQWAILYRGKYHTLPAVIFSGFNSILWWFVTIGMYLSVYPPPAAISGETALCVAATWIWIRSGWIPKGVGYADDYVTE